MKYSSVALVALIALSAPLSTFAQIPRFISYQGVLMDTSGILKPDGDYVLTLRLYPDSSGVAPVWMEQRTVKVKRGVFSTTMGGPAGFENIFSARLWLSVQVGTEPEHPTRIPLSSVAYSFRSLRTDTAQFALSAPQQAFADSARIAGTVADNSVTQNKIADGSVTSAKILDGTIQRADVAAGFKSPDADIADTVRRAPPTVVTPGSIDSAKLAPNSVTTSKLVDGAVTQSKISPGLSFPPSGPAGGDLAGSYPGPIISVNAVTNPKIADGAVTSAKIAPAQVVKSLNGLHDGITLRAAGGATINSSGDTITITAGSGGGTGIQGVQNTNNTLDIINPSGPTATINVKALGITAAQIGNGAVDSSKLGSSAVSTPKILDGAVVNAKLAANAITTDKILDGTILTADVASTFKAPDAVIADSARRAPPTVVNPGSIDSSKLATNSVTTAKLVDGAVTQAKVSPGVSLPPTGPAGGDLAGSYPTPVIAGNAVTNPKILDGAVANAKLAANAITTDKILDGTILTADVASTFKAPDALIADSTRNVRPASIDSSKLVPNSVTVTKILDGAVTPQKISGVLPMTKGGTGTSSFVQPGSIVFGSAASYTFDPLFTWDAGRRGLGIGTNTPAGALHVISSPTNGILFQGVPPGAGVALHVDDATGQLLKFSSSLRYKKVISDLERGNVLALRPVRFIWKSSGQEDIGLIAEEVEKVLPDLVVHTEDGQPEAVKYDRIALYLLQVVKKQQEQIDRLEARLRALSGSSQDKSSLEIDGRN